MNRSRPEGIRWVVNGVDAETIRSAKMLSAQHDVFLGDVIDEAVELLLEWIDSKGYLPKGWKEF